MTLQDAAQQVAKPAQHSGQGRDRITFPSRKYFRQVEGLGGPLSGTGQSPSILLLGQNEGDLLLQVGQVHLVGPGPLAAMAVEVRRFGPVLQTPGISQSLAAVVAVVRTPNGNDYGKDLLRQHREQSNHTHN